MKGRKGHGKVAIKSEQVELWKAFGRYGEGNVAICSKSNQDSIPEAENLPAEVISHRYKGSIPHRNKDSIPEAKNLPAEVISHRNDSIPLRNKDSIPEAKNMPAEVISHRERRRRLFAKASVEDNKSLAASLVLHREDIWSFSNFLPSMMDSIHPFYRIGEAESVLLAGGILRTEAPDSEVLPRRMEVEKEKEGRTIMEAPRKMEEDSIIEVPRKTEVEEFVLLAGELWSTGPPKTKVLPRRMEVEKEARAMIMEEHETPEPELMELYWMSVSQFRCYWDKQWSGHYGSFEDTTKIPPMRFTYKPAPEAVVHDDTLQIFSVKLAATRGTLHLPLDVFGMVAIRDQIDNNRNIIFHRERDYCQTLTEKDPYLVLSGPTRAVMFGVYNPVVIEVDLKVKGTTESKDVYLSFFVVPIKRYDTMFSHLFNRAYTSKLSTLEFSLGQIGFSVEATIFVHIIHGSWLDGLRGLFTASTTGLTDRRSICIGENKYSTGTGDERIILLDSGGEKLTIANDGKINFSRSVVSVEDEGELIVQVKAFKGEIEIVGKKTSFRALKAGKSINQIDMGFCEMEVIVFWSLISCCP